MKRLVAGFAIVSMISLGAYAGSYGGKGGCGGHGGHGKGDFMTSPIMLSGIELSQKQQDALFDLKIDMVEKEYEMSKNMKDKKGMANYIKDGKFDKNAFIKDRDQMSKERVALKAEKFERVYNILTPEQKEQFVKNLEAKSKSCGTKKGKKGCAGSGKSGKHSDGRR